MESYVEFLLVFLDDQGYECELREWDGGNEATLRVVYETEDEDEIVVSVLCFDDLVILRAIAEDEIGYSSASLEYVNSINQLYWDYRFSVDDDGDMMIERARVLEEHWPVFITAPTIVNEIKLLCECCIELQSEES